MPLGRVRKRTTVPPKEPEDASEMKTRVPADGGIFFPHWSHQEGRAGP